MCCLDRIRLLEQRRDRVKWILRNESHVWLVCVRIQSARGGNRLLFRKDSLGPTRAAIFTPTSSMPREQLDHRVGGGMSRNKRPPLIKSAGCCLMLDPHYSSSSMYLGDEGTYVCKAFSPRSYVIQKVANSFFLLFSILCGLLFVWRIQCGGVCVVRD